MLSELKPGRELISAFEDLLLNRAFAHKQRINLSSGNPSYDPFGPAVHLAQEAFADSAMRLYASGSGRVAQRNKLLGFCEDMGLSSEQHSINHQNIVYGLGITYLFSETLKAVIDKQKQQAKGKKPVIIMPTPGYGLFSMQPEAAGYDIETIPLDEKDGWILRPDYLAKRIAEINAEQGRYVSVFYNMNPHNPTGAVTPPDVLEKLSKILAGQKVFAIDDMAYYGLEYDIQATPMARSDFENTVTLFSTSKAFCLPQARSGFACGPSWLMEEINRAISLNMISLPSSVITTANACFGEGAQAQREQYLRGNLEKYRASFNVLRSVIDGIDSFDHVSEQSRKEIERVITKVLANHHETADILKNGIPELRLMNSDLGAGYFACLEVGDLDSRFYGERKLSNTFEFAAIAVDHRQTLALPLLSAMAGKEHANGIRVTFGGMSSERVVKGLRGLRDTVRQLSTKPDAAIQRQLEKSGRALDARFNL